MLQLAPDARQRLWQALIQAIEDYARRIADHRVTPTLDPAALRRQLGPFDFEKPLDPLEALHVAVRGLWEDQVHTPHPRYFGLFNPAPTTMGIAADTLVAAFNPQLAAWSHSPLASEIEQHLVRAIGGRFGYDAHHCDGTFTSGGAEANHTALLTALTHRFPAFARQGLRSLDRQPVFYISSEGHHSFQKAAKLCGLGTESVREVPIDHDWRMDLSRLKAQLAMDRERNLAPFLLVATAGTTTAGVIDPLPRLAEIAEQEKLWYHVDAAWGGAAILVPELRSTLLGIERADSITFDAHKWLSVPMAAGMYLTRHPDILTQTFGMDTGYMPREAKGMPVHDPYSHSMQWSRRFIGLKVFLSLAVAGWEGYRAALAHQTAMGNELRRKLVESGWRVVNQTPLPTVCFVDGRSITGSGKRGAGSEGDQKEFLEAVARQILNEGKAWISTAHVAGETVLRACVTNYLTQADDVRALVQALNEARSRT
jgi:glutamate/tyrosine decarboxylase-like PLP-dependent enzyme